MRILARENPRVSMDVLSPGLRERLDPSAFQSTEIYDVDFDPAPIRGQSIYAASFSVLFS